MRRIAILAYEGVDELDLVGVFEPLAKAKLCAEPPARLEPLLVGPRAAARGANGLYMAGIRPLQELSACGAIVVPGGWGVHDLRRDARLASLLGEAVARDTPIYAVCSGAFLLAYLGLVPGRRVAVHRWKQDELRQIAPCTLADGLVRDGWLRSIGGVTRTSVKGVEMAFEVLRDFWPDVITPLAERLETCPEERIGDD